MTSLTLSNTDFAAAPAKKSEHSAAKLSFGQRFVAAMIASRQRQAEIEIRRVRAMVGDSANVQIDYALLPFNAE